MPCRGRVVPTLSSTHVARFELELLFGNQRPASPPTGQICHPISCGASAIISQHRFTIVKEIYIDLPATQEAVAALSSTTSTNWSIGCQLLLKSVPSRRTHTLTPHTFAESISLTGSSSDSRLTPAASHTSHLTLHTSHRLELSAQSPATPTQPFVASPTPSGHCHWTNQSSPSRVEPSNQPPPPNSSRRRTPESVNYLGLPRFLRRRTCITQTRGPAFLPLQTRASDHLCNFDLPSPTETSCAIRPGERKRETSRQHQVLFKQLCLEKYFARKSRIIIIVLRLPGAHPPASCEWHCALSALSAWCCPLLVSMPLTVVERASTKS